MANKKNPSTDYRFPPDETSGVIGPALGCVAITPTDDDHLRRAIRAVTINSGGTIKYSWLGEIYQTDTLPVGYHVFYADKIWSDGTTATGITGWY